MTAAVAISIVCCVIVLLALGGNYGSFNVMISISGRCFLFLFCIKCRGGFIGWRNGVGCVEGGDLLFAVFSFSISSSKTSLESGG